jgi:hypothetical protein
MKGSQETCLERRINTFGKKGKSYFITQTLEAGF